jgi:ABC-type dipeptide/oligopeptide/nickel transport system permease subunit
VVALTGVILASTLGILSGYMGGTTDMVIQRFVDFMFALPVC